MRKAKVEERRRESGRRNGEAKRKAEWGSGVKGGKQLRKTEGKSSTREDLGKMFGK